MNELVNTVSGRRFHEETSMLSAEWKLRMKSVRMKLGYGMESFIDDYEERMGMMTEHLQKYDPSKPHEFIPYRPDVKDVERVILEMQERGSNEPIELE